MIHYEEALLSLPYQIWQNNPMRRRVRLLSPPMKMGPGRYTDSLRVTREDCQFVLRCLHDNSYSLKIVNTEPRPNVRRNPETSNWCASATDCRSTYANVQRRHCRSGKLRVSSFNNYCYCIFAFTGPRHYSRSTQSSEGGSRKGELFGVSYVLPSTTQALLTSSCTGALVIRRVYL